MEAIIKLKKLRFLDKILNLLAISTGLNAKNEEDKKQLTVLAKFLIKLCNESSSENEFTQKIIDNDGEFSPNTISSLYQMIKEYEEGNNFTQKSNKENNDKIIKENTNENNINSDNFHVTFVTSDNKEEVQKKFTSLSIPNQNKEELDIELGVIFDEEEVKKMFPKIKTNKNLSPIRVDEHRAKKKERSRSRSLDFGLRNKDKKVSRQRGEDSESKRKIPTELVQNGIYDGLVTRVEDYGCFVLLDIKKNRELSKESKSKTIQGFVHISQMKSIDYKSREKITSAHSLVRVKDHVKVKVISLENNKITLSMNQVDQCTGDDLSKKQMMAPTPKPETLVANPRPGYGELTGIALDTGTKTGKEMFLSVSMMIRAWKMEKKVSVGIVMI